MAIKEAIDDGSERVFVPGWTFHTPQATEFLILALRSPFSEWLNLRVLCFRIGCLKLTISEVQIMPNAPVVFISG